MDHRVVKNRYRAMVLAVLRVGDFDCGWRRRRRRRGRSSTSARRRARPGAASAVGQPLGAAAFPDFGAPSSAPFSGRAGPLGSHIPASALSTPGVPVFTIQGAQTTITQNAQPAQTTQYGDLELPADFVDYGTPGNMDLDAAINMLVSQNLDLLAAKLEIPMAEADVLTANLRANPIFYADTQLIPYGHFSFLRPGGPPQSDVNINYPLDITLQAGGTHGFGTRGQERDRGAASGRGPQPDRQPLHGLRGGRRRGPDLEVQRGLPDGNQASC